MQELLIGTVLGALFLVLNFIIYRRLGNLDNEVALLKYKREKDDRDMFRGLEERIDTLISSTDNDYEYLIQELSSAEENNSKAFRTFEEEIALLKSRVHILIKAKVRKK